MLVSSVPLSETHSSGRWPRPAMIVSSSRAIRRPESEVSAARHRHSRVKSSTTARMRKAYRHDAPRLIDEFVPGVAAMVDDVVVGSEDAVGEPVFPHELPDVFDRVELRRFWRQRHESDVVGDVEFVGEMPSRLIEQQHGVSAWRHGFGDFLEMQRHGGGIAERQDEAGGRAVGRTDRAEDVGRAGALVMWRRGTRPTPCPSPCDLVLLTDPRLVLEPDLYRLARGVSTGDLVQADGEVFLNVSIASVSWA